MKISRDGKLPALSRWAKNVLGQDPACIPVPSLRRQLLSLGEAERGEVLSFLQRVSKNRALLAEEEERIVLARLLVALLPQTAEVIEDLLLQTAKPLDFECHFSLFCYLDEVEPLVLREWVLRRVSDYLSRVRKNIANAAWMAGDLLGDYWRLEESLPVLINLLQSAKYVAGRKATIHGLEQALRRVGARPDLRHRILTALRVAAADDRSKDVRLAAQELTHQPE